MGRLVLRFNRPISTAAAARSLSKAASLRSRSSIFLRQSEMSMKIQRCESGTAGHERTHKFCHSCGFPSRILFNGVDDGAADDRGLGEFADGGELVGS